MHLPGMKNQVIHRQNTQGQGWHDVTSSSLNLRAMKTYKLSSNSSERPRRHLRSYSFQGHRTALPCVDNVAALLTQLTESVSPITQSSPQGSRGSSNILTTLHLGQGLSTFLSLFRSHWQPLQRLCSGYYNPFYANLISISSLKFKQFSRDSTTVVTSSLSPKISGRSSRTCQSCPIPPHPSPLLSILSSGSVHLHPIFCFWCLQRRP